MHVEPFERDRYFVTGRSGTRHLVDLDHEGKPACSCHRFNENTHHHGKPCHHILRAREWAKEQGTK